MASTEPALPTSPLLRLFSSPMEKSVVESPNCLLSGYFAFTFFDRNTDTRLDLSFSARQSSDTVRLDMWQTPPPQDRRTFQNESMVMPRYKAYSLIDSITQGTLPPALFAGDRRVPEYIPCNALNRMFFHADNLNALNTMRGTVEIKASPSSRGIKFDKSIVVYSESSDRHELGSPRLDDYKTVDVPDLPWRVVAKVFQDLLTPKTVRTEEQLNRGA